MKCLNEYRPRKKSKVCTWQEFFSETINFYYKKFIFFIKIKKIIYLSIMIKKSLKCFYIYFNLKLELWKIKTLWRKGNEILLK